MLSTSVNWNMMKYLERVIFNYIFFTNNKNLFNLKKLIKICSWNDHVIIKAPNLIAKTCFVFNEICILINNKKLLSLIQSPSLGGDWGSSAL